MSSAAVTLKSTDDHLITDDNYISTDLSSETLAFASIQNYFGIMTKLGQNSKALLPFSLPVCLLLPS